MAKKDRKNAGDPHEILRCHNIKVTPQRLHVYSILLNSHGHMSVDEVYERVHETMPSVSLATVYAILECFKKTGLARDIRIDPERSFYEVRMDNHHHFFCRECREITDIDLDPCSSLKNCKVAGHSIEEFQGYFYGVCRKCRKKQSRK